MNLNIKPYIVPLTKVEVLEEGIKGKKDYTPCRIGSQIRILPDALQSYCFAAWEPVIYDLLLVAGAVEFCDRLAHRPQRSWVREFNLIIPVHEVNRWKKPEVLNTLHEALGFLTGDKWNVEFVKRHVAYPTPAQQSLELSQSRKCVMPFSNGLDSRSVAHLYSVENGNDALVRVRVGSAKDRPKKRPFASIPFNVTVDTKESSVRSRGFKFSIISGLASYLAKVNEVIVPESGQGALGPSIITLGQIYPDYRSHPQFLRRVEKFLEAILNYKIRFEMPRLWTTKGETVNAYKSSGGNLDEILKTKSCWQNSRQVAVDKKSRQCGVCAACMLRRLSMHIAKVNEPLETYAWDLNNSDFFNGAPKELRDRKHKSMREYAIAGTMHLDQMANIQNWPNYQSLIYRYSLDIAQALNIEHEAAQKNLVDLFKRHADEWNSFLSSLNSKSFIKQWVRE